MKSPPSYQESVKKKFQQQQQQQAQQLLNPNESLEKHKRELKPINSSSGLTSKFKQPLATFLNGSTSANSVESTPIKTAGFMRQSDKPIQQNHTNVDQNNQTKQQQIKSSNNFTSEIEKELSNLTLSIEKEMEKQQLLQQQQQQQQHQLNTANEYFGKCAKCYKPVIGRADACQAMGSIFHYSCFVCVSCGRKLRGKSFYHLNNQIYCEEDYLYSGYLVNSDKCNKCGHIIVETILQAMGKSYHPNCFRCHVCNECLDGVPFTLDVNNRVYCTNDYYKLYAPKCAACGLSITPIPGTNETVRVVAMEKDFHIDCYVCQDCNIQLTDDPEKRCYPLDNSLLCYKCHIKRIEIDQLDKVILNNLNSNTNKLLSRLNQSSNNSSSSSTSSISSASTNKNRFINQNDFIYKNNGNNGNNNNTNGNSNVNGWHKNYPIDNL